MTSHSPNTPSIEDLAALYRRLNARVERIDGAVQQLLAEGKHHALTRPTWRDVQAIKKDITRLEGMLTAHR